MRTLIIKNNKIIPFLMFMCLVLFAGNFSYAASTSTGYGLNKPCNNTTNRCACKPEKTNAKGECSEYLVCLTDGRCKNPFESGVIIPTFKSPTDATSFADLICKVTKFVADTILPPIAVLMMLVVGFMFLVSGGAPQKSAAAQKALLFTVVGVFLLLLAPGIVKLIGDLFDNAPLQTAVSCGSITPGSIVKSFIGLVNWFSWFVAITSVVMGLYSGFLYLTARDDPAQAVKAAKVLSFVIIGVAVSILAFSIITIVKQFAGLG